MRLFRSRRSLFCSCFLCSSREFVRPPCRVNSSALHLAARVRARQCLFFYVCVCVLCVRVAQKSSVKQHGCVIFGDVRQPQLSFPFGLRARPSPVPAVCCARHCCPQEEASLGRACGQRGVPLRHPQISAPPASFRRVKRRLHPTRLWPTRLLSRDAGVRLLALTTRPRRNEKRWWFCCRRYRGGATVRPSRGMPHRSPVFAPQLNRGR